VKAVVIAADGTLRVADVAEPRPGPHEVLVDVAAAAVNRADLAQRKGRHEPGPGKAGDGARIAGMDAAGVVAEVGAEVDTIRTGDRVMGLVAGGYAQRAVLDARLAIPVPGTWSLVEAAAAVSGLQTGYDALVNAAGLAPGEVVVVQGASTPVGLTAIQIARHLGAGMIMGTIRTGRAHAQVVSAGADLVIHATSESVADAVLKVIGGRGADVIVDHVGGDTLPDSIRSLAIEGRLVSVGRLAGPTGELDLESLAYKRARIIGVTFRTRSIAQYAQIARAVGENLLPAMERGELRPIIDRTYALDRAAEAQAFMAADEHRGKLVLTVST
jgi:NADPH:quinone reductase